MLRILKMHLWLWLVMVIIPSAVLHLLPFGGTPPVFLAMTYFIGIALLFLLMTQLIAHWAGISVSTDSDDRQTPQTPPPYGYGMNPSTGSMMMNQHVDLEGRGYGQGYDGP